MTSPRATGALRRRAGRATSRKVGNRQSPTLAEVVGAEMYATWVQMLRTLVPGGRTHRLSIVIAAMLQYAAEVAYRSTRGKPPAGSVAASLLAAFEGADPEDVVGWLGDLLKRLFRDAKVPAGRVSARGDRYSIIDGALQEFVAWENLPWE